MAEASEIDIFFTYGRSWRHTLTKELGEIRDRLNVQLRVVMPSTKPPDNLALSEIAKRAGQSIERLVENITEATSFFEDMSADIWFIDLSQLYASYRFDNTIVASMYNHRRGQTEGVPTIMCERGGSFFDFFSADFDALVGGSGRRGLATKHKYRPPRKRSRPSK